MAGKSKYTEEQARKWEAAYLAGATIEQTGLNTDVACGTIRAWLRRLGTPMRPPGQRAGTSRNDSRSPRVPRLVRSSSRLRGARRIAATVGAHVIRLQRPPRTCNMLRMAYTPKQLADEAFTHSGSNPQRYPRYGDRAAAVRHVVTHMLEELPDLVHDAWYGGNDLNLLLETLLDITKRGEAD